MKAKGDFRETKFSSLNWMLGDFLKVSVLQVWGGGVGTDRRFEEVGIPVGLYAVVLIETVFVHVCGYFDYTLQLFSECLLLPAAIVHRAELLRLVRVENVVVYCVVHTERVQCVPFHFSYKSFSAFGRGWKQTQKNSKTKNIILQSALLY